MWQSGSVRYATPSSLRESWQPSGSCTVPARPTSRHRGLRSLLVNCPRIPCSLTLIDGTRGDSRLRPVSSRSWSSRPGLWCRNPLPDQTLLIGGAGIGRMPDYLVADALERGTLFRVLPQYEGDTVDAHALYPSHRSLSAKVRVFIDALVAHLKE